MSAERKPDSDRVAARADELTAEERAAGIDDPETTAEAILAESDERQADRRGTARERRRSEDTVEPPS